VLRKLTFLRWFSTLSKTKAAEWSLFYPYLTKQQKFEVEIKIEEGYFEYGYFELENCNFEKQSGELKANLT